MRISTQIISVNAANNPTRARNINFFSAGLTAGCEAKLHAQTFFKPRRYATPPSSIPPWRTNSSLFRNAARSTYHTHKNHCVSHRLGHSALDLSVRRHCPTTPCQHICKSTVVRYLPPPTSCANCHAPSPPRCAIVSQIRKPSCPLSCVQPLPTAVHIASSRLRHSRFVFQTLISAVEPSTVSLRLSPPPLLPPNFRYQISIV